MEIINLIYLFIIGTFIGSFLGVVIDRLPRNESIAKGRSYCENCHQKLSFLDLIPVLSFIFLRGKCRYCHKKLSLYYPLVELITGILFVVAGIHTGILYQVFSISYFVEVFYYLFIISSLIALFFIDLKYGILPFPIIFLATVATFLYLIFNTPYLILPNILAGVGAFLFFLAIFLGTKGRGMGFGDVVYVFLMGLLLGFPKIVLGLYIAFISGAVVALILVGLKLKKIKGGVVAFGPFLVAGTVISWFWGQKIIEMVTFYLTK